jgi:hypothetical protein
MSVLARTASMLLVCVSVVSATCPTVLPHRLNSSISQLIWIDDDNILVSTSGEHIYELFRLNRSRSSGWERLSERMSDLFVAGEPFSGRSGVRRVLLSDAASLQRFLVLTWTTRAYATTDGGQTFERFDTIDRATGQPVFVDGLTASAHDPALLLGFVWLQAQAGASSYAALCLSVDGGRTFSIVQRSVGQATWLDESILASDDQTIFYGAYEGNRSEGMSLFATHDLFASEPTLVAQHVAEIVAVTAGRIIIAVFKPSFNYADLSLLSSTDLGDTWLHVRIPDALGENATAHARFGVVERRTGRSAITLLKRTLASDLANTAQILRGNDLDDEFRVSLANVRSIVRQPGIVAVGKYGIFFAEQVQADGKLRSLISFDNAVTWQTQNVSLFIQDYFPDCQHLQCQDIVARDDGSLVFGVGTRNATGLAFMPNGLPGEVETFLSRDGGVSWSELFGFSTVQAMAGDVAVFSPNRRPSDTVWVSTDGGLTVQPCELGANLSVSFIAASPTGAPLFLLSARDGTVVLLNLTAGIAAQRACTDDDFEIATVGRDCALGFRTVVSRKSPAAMCTDRRDSAARTSFLSCNCTRADFECDECFLAVEPDACEPDFACLLRNKGISRDLVPLFCQGQFNRSSGFRLVRGNTCVGGVSLSPVLTPCPTLPPPTTALTETAVAETPQPTAVTQAESFCLACVCRRDSTCCTSVAEWDFACRSVATSRLCQRACPGVQPLARTRTLRGTATSAAAVVATTATSVASLSDGEIAGIVVGVVVFVALVAAGCLILRLRRSRTRYSQQRDDVQ